MNEKDDALLFEATLEGVPVKVGHATTEEIAVFAKPVGVDAKHRLDDVLDFWSLVAIRSGSATTVHALGWRRLLETTWITSPVVAIDMTEAEVRTRSGAVYFLGIQDQREVQPDLRAHLAYALKTWGYENVSS